MYLFSINYCNNVIIASFEYYLHGLFFVYQFMLEVAFVYALKHTPILCVTWASHLAVIHGFLNAVLVIALVSGDP